MQKSFASPVLTFSDRSTQRTQLVLGQVAVGAGLEHSELHTADGGVFGRDYTLTVDLPAMGSCLLRLAPEAPNPDAARISANKALNAKRRAARSTKAAANSNK